jgi:cytidylate kinase
LGRKIPLIFVAEWAKKKKKSAALARKKTGMERKTPSLEIVTIDGPAGAGKSTVSKMLARRLGYVYLDTGAMYRAVALLVRKERVGPEDDRALEGLCRGIEIAFREGKDGQRLVCRGEDVTEAIRDPEIGRLASAVSMRRPVREAMAALQRKMGSGGRIVAEGRDTGTVIFPRARYKFFLDAEPRERALRRYRELKAKGLGLELEEVDREVRERDAQDSSRELAPLRPAEDARLVDSTGLTPEEVVDRMLTAMSK